MSKKKGFLILICVQLFSLCLNKIFAQDFAWAGHLTGTAQSREIHGLTTDADGNIYITGFFSGTVDFDPGTGVHNMVTPASIADIFIAKYSAGGQYIWSFQLGTAAETDAGGSITIDSRGYISVTGNFTGTVDFDPGTGVYNQTSYGFSDVYMARYTLDGAFVWAKQIGTTGYDNAWGTVVSNSQNELIYLFTLGVFNIDIDPGPAVNMVSTAGSTDFLIMKFDLAGNLVSVKQFGGTGDDQISKIKLDQQDNILLAGRLKGTGDYDPGPGVFNLSSASSSDFDATAVKLDPSGNLIWAKLWNNGTANAYASDIVKDAEGNLYFTGNFNGTIDFDPGAGTTNGTSNGLQDCFAVKLTSTGNFIWGKSFGGTSDDYCPGGALTSIGGISLFGNFKGTVDFDPGAGVTSLNSTDYSVFISTLTKDGDFVQVQKIGGTVYTYVTGVHVQNSDNLVIWGDYTGTTDFNPGPNIFNLSSANPYPWADLFLVKFSPANWITGTTFKDNNGDGIRQSNEPVLPGVMIKAQRTTGETYYGRSNDNGVYSLEAGSGTYTVTPGLPLYYSVISPASHTANFGTGIGQQDTANHFGLKPSAVVKDLRVSINNLGPARAGMPTYYRLTYTNAGTDTVSGSVTMTHDSHQSFDLAGPVHTSYTNPTVTWNFSDLPPGMSRNITVRTTVDIFVTLGSVLKLYATVNPIPGDFDPANNQDSIYHIVTGSFDPNDKKVIPAGALPIQYLTNGGYLDYMVRFQNTGNDTAFLVVIKDTLSTILDVQSFEMISASHPYKLDVKGTGILEWRFENILLPDSNVNEAASHGYVRYRIKPKTTVAVGNIIRNKASIFFDYNAPVVTNETSNIVTVATGVGNPSPDELVAKLFPNPTGSLLYISTKGKFIYTVYDLLGKKIREVLQNRDEAILDVSTLPKGVYVIEVSNGQKKTSRKIIIQ